LGIAARLSMLERILCNLVQALVVPACVPHIEGVTAPASLLINLNKQDRS
jgi:hypothetical protein